MPKRSSREKPAFGMTDRQARLVVVGAGEGRGAFGVGEPLISIKGSGSGCCLGFRFRFHWINYSARIESSTLNCFYNLFMRGCRNGCMDGCRVGLIINNADGLIENVMRKMIDGFPNRFVDGGGAGSFFSFFAEELEQMIPETRVSPRDPQREVCNALKRVSVRTRGPFNGLVHHGFLFGDFKETTVYGFPLPLSSSHLDQVLHLAARLLRVALRLLRGQVVPLFLSCCRSPLVMILEPGLRHFPSPKTWEPPLLAKTLAMAPIESRPVAI